MKVNYVETCKIKLSNIRLFICVRTVWILCISQGLLWLGNGKKVRALKGARLKEIDFTGCHWRTGSIFSPGNYLLITQPILFGIDMQPSARWNRNVWVIEKYEGEIVNTRGIWEEICCECVITEWKVWESRKMR